MSRSTRISGQPETLSVVLTPGAEVTVRQTDRGRTTALIIGIAALLIGLAALAAAQIDYGFPDSGGGPSFLVPFPAGPILVAEMYVLLFGFFMAVPTALRAEESNAGWFVLLSAGFAGWWIAFFLTGRRNAVVLS